VVSAIPLCLFSLLPCWPVSSLQLFRLRCKFGGHHTANPTNPFIMAVRIFSLPVVFITLFLFALAENTKAQAPVQKESNAAFTIENYYKVKWGYAEEFISLWKKNHYPLLKKALEKGDLLRVTASRPRLHDGEETRWDFRVTLVFKNAALAYDDNLTTPYKKELYPDEEKLKKDEQHRFELLLAHWDVEVKEESLNQ
jgi:hypothetical protein